MNEYTNNPKGQGRSNVGAPGSVLVEAAQDEQAPRHLSRLHTIRTVL